MKGVFIILLFALSSINALNNYNSMRKMILTINSMQSTWKAGVNERFIGETPEQMKILMGVPMDKKPAKLPAKQIEIKNDLPENFDLREQYPDCEALQEIRDQGSCGSCWAFSTAEVMSDRFCIASGQKRQDRLSPLHLVSCCKDCNVRILLI